MRIEIRTVLFAAWTMTIAQMVRHRPRRPLLHFGKRIEVRLRGGIRFGSERHIDCRASPVRQTQMRVILARHPPPYAIRSPAEPSDGTPCQAPLRSVASRALPYLQGTSLHRHLKQLLVRRCPQGHSRQKFLLRRPHRPMCSKSLCHGYWQEQNRRLLDRDRSALPWTQARLHARQAR